MYCNVIMINLERRMQHKRLQGLCTKNGQWYSQTEGNDMLNRCDFGCVLKVENVPDRRRSTGRLFQARGPATARARSPMVERRVAGTRTSAVDVERCRRRESTSDSGWINSDRYCGAAPFRQRCTRTHSLYWMRSSTRSQCRFTSNGVTMVELARISRESCCSVQHGLNPIKVTLRQSCQGDVTVVDLGPIINNFWYDE